MRSVFIQSLKYFKNSISSIFRKPKNSLLQNLRLYERWKRTLLDQASSSTPWLSFTAIDFLETIINSNWEIFEYGSGGSTLYFSKKIRRVISVEHDEKYFKFVMQNLTSMKAQNCNLQLVLPKAVDNTTKTDPSDPYSYCSAGKEYQGYDFRDYVKTIDSFANESFDLVAIDGRARPSCVLHAHEKVKKGGWLLLDDSERPDYNKAKLLLKGWEQHAFFGPGPYISLFFETTFWKKPND